MKEKKRLPILLGLLVAITVTVGVSFAIWQITLQQESTNVITTGCFEVTFTDANPINLQSAYPISDEEGDSLMPYEFTITNTCDGLASFQINLEVLNTTTLTDLSYIKETLNESTKTIASKLLTTNETMTKTLTEATTSYKLQTGYLNANESKTYNLRLWLDENTPTEDTYMNKTFESKITVVTSFLNEPPKTTAEQNIEYIKSKAAFEMIIEDDETVDHNLRYIGANPNNYIDIGDRDAEGNVIPWRIIGSFNNVDDGTGKKETRLKVIRSEGIGAYSWDSSETSINNGNGINEWSVADLMKLLNPGYESELVGGSLYWNRSSGSFYNGQNNATTSCNFTSSGISETAKKAIGNALWHTGSNGTEAIWTSILTSKFYELERSTNNGKICTSGTYCNDTITRTTEWTGHIGLMYPSDYGYATSGGTTTNRDACLNTVLYSWDGSEVSDCKTNNWLYDSSTWQFTMIPDAYSSSADHVYVISTVGSVRYSSAYGVGLVRPASYLKSNVLITGGEGTLDNMFTIVQG